jgi:peptidyl-prolyl cis-trans isomerase A (cyclophilin A)
MGKVSSVFAAVLMFSFFCWSQTAVPSKAYPVKRVAPHSPAHPTAVIDTTAGKLSCVLFPDKAPIGVANFIGLSKGTKEWTDPITGKKKTGVPLYNGTIFHRVIPDFMIQGGDPKGDGTGDPGYKFKNEVSPDLLFDQPGRLAYANAGPDTNGSQFFVTEGAYPSLNGGYTIFGQCDDASVTLVKQIARMARDSGDRPYQPVKINQITIGNGAVAHKPAAAGPVRKKAAPVTPKPQQ